jgi:hypothetical protein
MFEARLTEAHPHVNEARRKAQAACHQDVAVCRQVAAIHARPNRPDAALADEHTACAIKAAFGV